LVGKEEVYGNLSEILALLTTPMGSTSTRNLIGTNFSIVIPFKLNGSINFQFRRKYSCKRKR